MYDVGFVVGKFAPLTTGHINLINIAATECKKLVVILSHDNRWLVKQSFRDQKVLNFKNCFRWLSQTYADLEHITIDYIIEDSVPEFPDGWKEYTHLLLDIINKYSKENETLAMFGGELAFDVKYKHYLPTLDYIVVDADRTNVPISATQIRNDLYKYWEYLPSVVRSEYTQRVCVIGTESSGKTTLVKYLAKLFNTSWVEEYGRVYCETVLVGSEVSLRSSDYPIIAYRQKELEQEALRTANRVCFIDTNAFVTEYYHRLHEGKSNAIVSAIAHSEQYDLVIILEPTVPWVEDGLRVNSDRTKTSAFFQQMLLEFPNQTPRGRTHIISNTSYKGRLEEAVIIINKFLSAVGDDTSDSKKLA